MSSPLGERPASPLARVPEPRRLATPHEFVVANPADVEVGRSLNLPAAVRCARGFGVGATVRVRGQVVVLVVPTEEEPCRP